MRQHAGPGECLQLRVAAGLERLAAGETWMPELISRSAPRCRRWWRPCSGSCDGEVRGSAVQSPRVTCSASAAPAARHMQRVCSACSPSPAHSRSPARRADKRLLPSALLDNLVLQTGRERDDAGRLCVLHQPGHILRGGGGSRGQREQASHKYGAKHGSNGGGALKGRWCVRSIAPSRALSIERVAEASEQPACPHMALRALQRRLVVSARGAHGHSHGGVSCGHSHGADPPDEQGTLEGGEEEETVVPPPAPLPEDRCVAWSGVASCSAFRL